MKKRFVLQWHITEQCSNTCAHCYMDKSKPCTNTSVVQFKQIIAQFVDFLDFYNAQNNNGKLIRGHINITGGDPLLHPDFDLLLELLYQNKKYFSYGILANAHYIDVAIIKKLKQFDAEFLQLSLDGNAAMHDQLRGAGDYKRTVDALKLLHKSRFKTYVSFTVNAFNAQSFKDVALVCRKYKVAKLWTDRYVPIGNGAKEMELLLDTQKFYDFVREVHQLRKKLNWFAKTNIFLERSLMFQITGERPYSCSAGVSLLALMPNGTVFPCRRLPIACGNIFEKSLVEIYSSDKFLNELQQPIPPKACKYCSWFVYCKGGARCIAFALTGDAMQADVDCAIARKYLLDK